MEPEKNLGGRPKLAPDEKLVQRSIRLSAEDWAKIDALDGLKGLRKILGLLSAERWAQLLLLGPDWLRKLIDRARPPKPD